MIKKGRFIFTREPELCDRFYLKQGDAHTVLHEAPGNQVRCWVTSPPYYHQVDYGVRGQYGLEASVNKYIEQQSWVASEMLRCSTPDANLFWVIRDSYNGSGGAGGDFKKDGEYRMKVKGAYDPAYSKKTQLLIPERTRLAFQSVGWQPIMSIIWDKDDPRRGAVDRPSYSYEQVLVFSASTDHYWDREAVLQEYSPASLKQLEKEYKSQSHGGYVERGQEDPSDSKRSMIESMKRKPGAYLRGIWKIASGSQPEVEVTGVMERAIASFPELLAEICVNLGSAPGDVVGDPYCGFGTTMVAALKWGRIGWGIELNPVSWEASLTRIGNLIDVETLSRMNKVSNFS